MYREHRARFLARLTEEDAAAVVFTGSTRVRNADCDYRFRPHSDFWYLTGFAEPEAVLVLLPGREEGESVLFLRERDRSQETWNGRRLGVERAPEALGVDQARPVDELWSGLEELLRGRARIVYRLGEDHGRDLAFQDVLGSLRQGARGGVVPPAELVDPSLWLHEQRLFKTAAEVELMRSAAAITAEAHLAAMAAAEPGRNEAELDALLEYTFRRNGSTGPAYNNIVAGGPNACILHYIENDQPLADGDLVLIDAGAERDYYASDVTRTFPVNGSFSPEQRALYEVVLDAQKAAVRAVRPGASFVSVHEVATERLCRGLLELGLLKGSLEEVLAEKSYERFYMHRTGHWLGLDVHDCGAYWREGASRLLEPGMVTTVEPGLYVAEDDETVEARWRGIGIRIEDDLLVTRDGHEILSAAIPKEIDEVEAACRGAALQPT